MGERRRARLPGRCVAALCTTLALAIAAAAQNAADVKPSPQHLAWHELEVGALIHFGTNTYLDREWGDGTADPGIFNPQQFDPGQWMRAIRAAGGNYVILVAKHHDGFCLWPTGQTEYSVKSSPWRNGKGDVVREVAEAARKHGLKFGVYLSPWDRHEPRYADPAEYDKFYTAQLSELARNYGELVEFWLDGAGSAGHVYDFKGYLEELRTYQPNTLVFADMALFEYGDIRWVGNQDGVIPYENWNVMDRHGYLRWRPAEADTPLHKGQWFWRPNHESTLQSLAELMRIYEHSVGRGGQLVLGLAPDPRGLLPETDVKRLEEFGAEVRRRYGNNLVAQRVRRPGEAAAALDGDRHTFWAAQPGERHAVIEVRFAQPVSLDRALIMEWQNEGQRIQHYRVETWNGRAWEGVAEGRAIGHKKIDAFPPVQTTRVRLNILAAAGKIRIREFQLFGNGARSAGAGRP